MKIFLTKYKNVNNTEPNYFQVPSPVVVDYMVINHEQILMDAFGDYTDEVVTRDNPQSFTAGDYEIQVSLLRNITSNLGKNVSEFFDPATDYGYPVGFKVAYGEDENNIERGDIIDVSSIKTNWRKDDRGWILSYTAIGAEEQYIQNASRSDAEKINAVLFPDYRFWLQGLIAKTTVFSNVTFLNDTYFRFNQAGFSPIIHFAYHDNWLDFASTIDRWTVFLNFCKDHGMMYRVSHPLTCNPAQMDKFNFRVFFLSDNRGTANITVRGDQDYIIGNTLEYAKPYVAMLYISYTVDPNLDFLGTLFLDRNNTQVGYTNADSGGHGQANDLNNFRRIYRPDRWNRNGKVYNEEDILFLASDRAYIYTNNGVNIGMSIGRSLVRSVQYSNPLVRWLDYGFNQIVMLTAGREYRRLVTGVKQYIELSGKYNKSAPPKLFQRINERGKFWDIIRITNKKNFTSSAKFYGVEV